MQFLKILVSVLSGLLVLEAASATPIPMRPAPDFIATTTTGETITLSELKGYNVVLEWTNHECPYVQKHYRSGNMQKTQRALTEDGVIWLSIISSAEGQQGYVTAEQANKLTASRGAYNSHVILDPSGDIGHLYEARTTPQMFLINKEGTLEYMGAIDDKPSTRQETVKDAQNYLLTAWEEIKAGQAVTLRSTKPYGCSVKYVD